MPSAELTRILQEDRQDLETLEGKRVDRPPLKDVLILPDNKLRPFFSKLILADNLPVGEARNEAFIVIQTEIQQEMAGLEVEHFLKTDDDQGTNLEEEYADWNYLLAEFVLPNIVEVVPEPEKKELPTKLRNFNLMMESSGITPFNVDVSSEAEYIMERKRLSREICAFLMNSIISQLKNSSATYIPSNTESLWSNITLNLGIPGESNGDLDKFLGHVPENLKIEIAGVTDNRPFLGETVGYIAEMVKFVQAEHNRAVHLKSYKSPDEYIDAIGSAAYQKERFGKDQIRDLLKKDGAQELVEKHDSERDLNNSVFRAFRIIKQLFVQLGDLPDVEFGAHPGPGASQAEVDDFNRKVQIVEDFKRDKSSINMYPVGLMQEAAVGEKTLTASQQDTFDAFAAQLEGEFSPEVIEVAFRWAVASNRSTGLEEELDVRPAIEKDKDDHVTGWHHKSMAPRSATRLFHTHTWSEYSVDVKGSARQPVAIELARKRPSMGLPAEMNWLATVNVGGEPVKKSMYQIWRDGLWDEVEDDGDFPDDPNAVYQQHLMFMAKTYYDFLFMHDKAGRVLPNRKEMSHFQPTVKARGDYGLARIFMDQSKTGQLKTSDAHKLLDRLYSDDDDEKIITVAVDELPDFTASDLIKAIEYSWDNTPLVEENFRRMFRSPSGGEHPIIMNALGISSGKRSKEQFVMWTFFTMLVMAEVERFKIPNHVREEAAEQWENDTINLDHPIETVGKQHPLHWGERRALKYFLLNLQADLPAGYIEYHFNEDQIDIILAKMGISDDDPACRMADIKWLMKPETLRKHMTVTPSGVSIFDPISELMGLGEGVT